MIGDALPKLLSHESELPIELFEDVNGAIPDAIQSRVEGEEPGPWRRIAGLFGEAGDSTDRTLAPILRREFPVDRRTACDARVWRYATIWHLREYVFSRWASKDGRVASDRLMGGLRRNAAARLWWMVETLAADGQEASREIGAALASSERFKLWLLDFNSFHGRAWLARAVVDWLHREEKNPPDKEVDLFFGALGRLSNVRAFDLFEQEPEMILSEVDVELERLAPVLHTG